MRAMASTAVVALTLCPVARAEHIRVRVNGDPVMFGAAHPRQMNGRVMVPLRGVLEQIGADVQWISAENAVHATRGDTEIHLPIGSRYATVNGRRMYLDVPARAIAGHTMVPLRFVSEALGANVAWSDYNRTVMIDTHGTFNAYRRPNGNTDDRWNDDRGARYDQNSRRWNRNRSQNLLPTGTVMPVRLDTSLGSREKSAGDRFTATVENGADDAGLPQGTQFEGVVREAIPSRDGKPGVLDVDFRRVIFPDGAARTIQASVSGLDNKSVVRTSGRLQARSRTGNNRMKWIGIGAGAGLLISTLTKGNALVDSLLGAGAGFLYNELQRKGAGNVELSSGTQMGVRLDQRLAFAAPYGDETTP